MMARTCTLPDAQSLPLELAAVRARRTRDLLRATAFAAGLRGVIIIAELAGYWFWQADVLLVDAVSSLADLFASTALMGFIWLAARPPDVRHPLGHGRFEPLAGMQLGLLIALLGLGLGVRQVWQMSAGWPRAESALPAGAFALPLMAVVLLEAARYRLVRLARREQSTALLAEAAHYRADALTSFIATLTLLLAGLLPEQVWMVDAIGALLLSGVMVLLGLLAMRENARQLLDEAAPAERMVEIRSAAMAVSGVLGTEKLAVQTSGPDAHVDIDVEVCGDLSVQDGHAIAQQVRLEIQRTWPAVRDVIVHIEPHRPPGSSKPST